MKLLALFQSPVRPIFIFFLLLAVLPASTEPVNHTFMLYAHQDAPTHLRHLPLTHGTEFPFYRLFTLGSRGRIAKFYFERDGNGRRIGAVRCVTYDWTKYPRAHHHAMSQNPPVGKLDFRLISTPEWNNGSIVQLGEAINIYRDPNRPRGAWTEEDFRTPQFCLMPNGYLGLGKCQSFPILGKYPTKNFRFRIQWDLDEDGREVEQSW